MSEKIEPQPPDDAFPKLTEEEFAFTLFKQEFGDIASDLSEARNSIETQTLEFFFPKLAEEESVINLLNEEYGDKAFALIEAMKSQGEIPPGYEHFSDHISDLISEKEEYLNSFEIECFTSYSDTSEVSIMKFAEMYWVKNFEFGDISYFSSEADARKAAEIAFNFKWLEA
jgi:hypothetical protein